MLPRGFDRLLAWVWILFVACAFALLAFRLMQLGQTLPIYDPWIQLGSACLAAHAVHHLGKKHLWTYAACFLIAGIVVPNFAPTYSIIQSTFFGGTILGWAWHAIRKELTLTEAHHDAIEKLGKS